MIIWQPEIQIAAGHDNEAGFATLESVLAPTVTRFGTAQHYAFYQPGELRAKGNGVRFARGYPSTQWVISLLTWAQHYNLLNTYCSTTTYSGLVTIRTTADNPDAYANFNATLRLPTPSEFQPDVIDGNPIIRNYTMRFTRMEST